MLLRFHELREQKRMIEQIHLDLAIAFVQGALGKPSRGPRPAASGSVAQSPSGHLKRKTYTHHLLTGLKYQLLIQLQQIEPVLRLPGFCVNLCQKLPH